MRPVPLLLSTVHSVGEAMGQNLGAGTRKSYVRGNPAMEEPLEDLVVLLDPVGDLEDPVPWLGDPMEDLGDQMVDLGDPMEDLEDPVHW